MVWFWHFTAIDQRRFMRKNAGKWCTYCIRAMKHWLSLNIWFPVSWLRMQLLFFWIQNMVSPLLIFGHRVPVLLLLYEKGAWGMMRQQKVSPARLARIGLLNALRELGADAVKVLIYYDVDNDKPGKSMISNKLGLSSREWMSGRRYTLFPLKFWLWYDAC